MNLAALLARSDYQAEMAADGIEALEKLARQRFDIVLSDVAMPRLALFEQIGFAWPETRIIDDRLFSVQRRQPIHGRRRA
jgi:CheY-like chemotaxis protein